MKVLREAIIDQYDHLTISYEARLVQMKEILLEFQREGSQMLIFKHKEKDDQQNTLMHKAILCCEPPLDSETPESKTTVETFTEAHNNVGQSM